MHHETLERTSIQENVYDLIQIKCNYRCCYVGLLLIGILLEMKGLIWKWRFGICGIGFCGIVRKWILNNFDFFYKGWFDFLSVFSLGVILKSRQRQIWMPPSLIKDVLRFFCLGNDFSALNLIFSRTLKGIFNLV